MPATPLTPKRRLIPHATLSPSAPLLHWQAALLARAAKAQMSEAQAQAEAEAKARAARAPASVPAVGSKVGGEWDGGGGGSREGRQGKGQVGPCAGEAALVGEGSR
jgi:hypothetical protein